MFRSDAQLARACQELCDHAGLRGMWTPSGPSEEAIAHYEAGGRPLSSGERVVLLTAWAFWNSADKVVLADVVYRLDGKNLRAVATLMLALAAGGHAIDEWIAAMRTTPVRSAARPFGPAGFRGAITPRGDGSSGPAPSPAQRSSPGCPCHGSCTSARASSSRTPPTWCSLRSTTRATPSARGGGHPLGACIPAKRSRISRALKRTGADARRLARGHMRAEEPAAGAAGFGEPPGEAWGRPSAAPVWRGPTPPHSARVTDLAQTSARRACGAPARRQGPRRYETPMSGAGDRATI